MVRQSIIFSFIILLTLSCSTTKKFPVSDVVPAANIKAKISTDDSSNTKVKITAIHLANPERLSPSKKLYVVWIITENDLLKNLGKIVQDNDSKISVTFNTPFEIKEIFITAENDGNVNKPGKTMITSKKL